MCAHLISRHSQLNVDEHGQDCSHCRWTLLEIFLQGEIWAQWLLGTTEICGTLCRRKMQTEGWYHPADNMLSHEGQTLPALFSHSFLSHRIITYHLPLFLNAHSCSCIVCSQQFSQKCILGRWVHRPITFYAIIHGHRTLKAPHPVRSAKLTRVPLS